MGIGGSNPSLSAKAGVIQWQNRSFPSFLRGFDSHRPLHFFDSHWFDFHTDSMQTKRLLDTISCLLILPVALLVMLVCIVAVLLIEGRPVFFLQERAGLNGVPFKLIKFRTMKTGEGDDAARLTKFGRFLRASSLDELPEIFHVLSGKMSIVGPRPLPVRYLQRYTREQMRRHEVRPGITGWAQVNGRNAISWEEKFRRDVWYVDNRSLLLDMKIILMTFSTVLLARGISAENSATMEEFKGGSE